MKAFIFTDKSDEWSYTVQGILEISLEDKPAFREEGNPVEVSIPCPFMRVAKKVLQQGLSHPDFEKVGETGCATLFFDGKEKIPFVPLLGIMQRSLFFVYNPRKFEKTDSFAQWIVGEGFSHLLPKKALRARRKGGK